MHCATPLLRVALLCLPALLARPAFAQGAIALEELKQLHDRIARVDQVLAPQEAADARSRLRAWNFSPESLKPPQRELLARVETFTALGLGDAGGARKAWARLADLAPRKRSTIEAGYLVAAAAADAQQADAHLKEIFEKMTGAEKQQVMERRRWLRQVGKLAPQVTIDAGEATIAARDRKRVVLLIDFWNTLNPPGSGELATLQRIYEEHKGSATFSMVGINADSEARLEKARTYARENGLTWPQCYEKKSAGAPLTHAAFEAGRPPWQVLIDGRGVIRAVGSAGEPGFRYALRAALAETVGDFDAPAPRDLDGRTPDELRSAAALPGAVSSPDPTAPETPPPAPDLKSDPQAANLFRQAQILMKNKTKKAEAKALLQRIIDEYPNSLEARDARDILPHL